MRQVLDATLGVYNFMDGCMIELEARVRVLVARQSDRYDAVIDSGPKGKKADRRK